MLSTQDEGWWRIALDQLGIPYSYISTQDVATDTKLTSKYDVIILHLLDRQPAVIISGLPKYETQCVEKRFANAKPRDIYRTDDIRPD